MVAPKLEGSSMTTVNAENSVENVIIAQCRDTLSKSWYHPKNDVVSPMNRTNTEQHVVFRPSPRKEEVLLVIPPGDRLPGLISNNVRNRGYPIAMQLS